MNKSLTPFIFLVSPPTGGEEDSPAGGCGWGVFVLKYGCCNRGTFSNIKAVVRRHPANQAGFLRNYYKESLM
jgi:hypothetical protein